MNINSEKTFEFAEKGDKIPSRITECLLKFSSKNMRKNHEKLRKKWKICIIIEYNLAKMTKNRFKM